jgi:hypothetical protein
MAINADQRRMSGDVQTDCQSLRLPSSHCSRSPEFNHRGPDPGCDLRPSSHSRPQSGTRRYIRAPPALEKSADPTASADQPKHGRCHMVNGSLTKNPARLSTERGLCKGPDTQRGRSGSDTAQVKQRCQRP